MPDIAALADEFTGFVVYLGANAGGPGFFIFGGTSLASPLTAGLIAVIDTARAAASKAPLGGNLNALLYQAAASYHYRYYDVTTGNNACTNNCNPTTGGSSATSGWDDVSGLGVVLGPAMAAYLVSLP